MAGRQRRDVGPLGSPPTIVTLLTVFAFAASPVATVVLLVAKLGWVTALLLGWIVAPIAAVAGAMLVLVWTTPFRRTDTLSLRPHRRGAPPVAGPVDTPIAISVIMPVYNGRHYLVRSLPPLVRMAEAGAIREVILVDDGSDDGSADYGREIGATVTLSPARRGPGSARNIGAHQAEGDVLWFVDADVVVHPEAVERVWAAFQDPTVVAVFGSYDDRPAGPNFGSQYKNLVHHHYHQHANPEASTFWTGCGAARKTAMLSIGGFDAEAYAIPAMEDVDLGYRLRQNGGSIRLDRNLLSTHLKNWTVPELVRTDIFQRALPWSRIMLKQEQVLDDLNVGTFERLRAVCAGLMVLVVIAVAAGLVSPWWLVPTLLTTLTGNWHLFRLFHRRHGVLFALAALAFHQVYYLYSSAAFVWCWLESKAAKLFPARSGAARAENVEAQDSVPLSP